MTKKIMALMATSELTRDQLSWLTGDQLRGLTGYQLRGLTGYQLRWLTGDQLRGLTEDQLRWLTGDQLSWLTGDQLSWLTGDQKIPKVKSLYSAMLADIQKSARLLDQKTFGPDNGPAEDNVCKTPMCIAGHTVSLAGTAGYDLCKRLGFAGAATLIHRMSRPDAPLPRYDSYPNEWALAYIEARAAEESQS